MPRTKKEARKRKPGEETEKVRKWREKRLALGIPPAPRMGTADFFKHSYQQYCYYQKGNKLSYREWHQAHWAPRTQTESDSSTQNSHEQRQYPGAASAAVEHDSPTDSESPGSAKLDK